MSGTARPSFFTAFVIGSFLIAPSSVAAQQVLGQIVGQATGEPVASAVVTARDEAGEIIAFTMSDDLGEYSMALPGLGIYSFEARALGYSPLSATGVSVQDRLPLLLHFQFDVQPVELEGVAVEAESRLRLDRHLTALGLRISDLDERLVTRAEIEVHQTARDFGSVLQWQRISGAQVWRSENWEGRGDPFLCVTQLRGRTASGKNRCAITVLDGMVVQSDVAASIDPDDLENIVVLSPIEATRLWGTVAGGGAVLLFTRNR